VVYHLKTLMSVGCLHEVYLSLRLLVCRYLGPEPFTNNGVRLSLAHHHLLALMAPRPFLLIGGQYDSVTAWQYLCACILNLCARAHVS